MALKNKINNSSLPLFIMGAINIDSECLYVRIGSQTWDKKKNYISLEWYNYNEETNEILSNIPLLTKSYEHVADLQGDNFVDQGYEYLKTLPEFEGFEDC